MLFWDGNWTENHTIISNFAKLDEELIDHNIKVANVLDRESEWD